MYIRQVPLPVSCAHFSVKCGPSHPEGSARTQESGLGRRKQAGENIMESEFFRGKSAGNFIFYFPEPWVQTFSEGGRSSQ